VEVSHELDPLLGDLDVIYVLRLQRERMSQALLPSLREYRAGYGLNAVRAARLPDRALIMHPGPLNKGVEMDAEVADLPASVITAQVANGVAVRMAVLWKLLGSGVDIGLPVFGLARHPAAVADVGGDALVADVGGDALVADVGGDALVADVGGDALVADVGGDALVADVGPGAPGGDPSERDADRGRYDPTLETASRSASMAEGSYDRG
jgi:hypothetical protein